jgi:hypothetical protein
MKSERHGELRFDFANLQCKGSHFSGPFALQIGVNPRSIQTYKITKPDPSRNPKKLETFPTQCLQAGTGKSKQQQEKKRL